MRGHVVVAVISIAAATFVAVRTDADVIMSPAGLNATLKKLERLRQQTRSSRAAEQNEALFQIGVEGDALAALMNQEVESHGMEQRELIDLAVDRTKALGVSITYNRTKKKFFYDGAAFREYVAQAPAGVHAADAGFALISYQFYQSEATDTDALMKAAAAKKAFLSRFPNYKGNPEVSLFLAVDYRDLYRRFHDAGDDTTAARYRAMTRAEYQRIVRRYPATEQADTARQLLRRFDEELGHVR